MIIDGKSIAKGIRQQTKERVEAARKNKPFKPTLAIIQVDARPDSSTYVNMKKKAAAEIGADCIHETFEKNISESELLACIDKLNLDKRVHGIIVQLPLPSHISEDKVKAAVIPSKDVDGFGPVNVGALGSKSGDPLFIPCTPRGIMVLLEKSGVQLEGANAVVLGRSDIVGLPMAHLLRKSNATVTLLHSKSRNIETHLSNADIVVAAIGVPGFVKGNMLKKGVVVIDVGTTFVEDSSRASGHRLAGDVDFESAKDVASLITPVPGGVGPMTVAMLLQAVVEAAERQTSSNGLEPLPLSLKRPVPADFEISRGQRPKPITKLASEIGILPTELEPYGEVKAKVSLGVLERLKKRSNGKYILVAGMTPTPLGEGKSTTTVGLAQALSAHLHKNAIACVRQPSMGPTFGTKGGAAGGGYSQVIPMEEFNLHLTGDIHAITAATNLLAAAIDARMFHENTQKDAALYRRLVPEKKGSRKFSKVMFKRLEKLGIEKTNPDDLTEEEIAKFARLDIDPATITWRRVVDCNDRFLRGITVGQAPTEKGQTRETGFDITVASEIMAVLTLSGSLKEMRERLGKMVVASSKSGAPVTADDIGCGGALAALMKDAIKPNLMQTLEGTPVMIHAGPFANISIGANSIIADKVALKLTGTEEETDEPGYVITEAGFDFTMGGERFLNIKCRASGLVPDAVVIVVTVRALKSHVPNPDEPDLRAGCSNLVKQIENARRYNLPVVVAINHISSDLDEEHDIIREVAKEAGAVDAVVSSHWAKGGEGAKDLAQAVMAACESERKPFEFLYDPENLSPEEKLNVIAREMYGASGVELSPLAKQKIETYTAQGFGNLPICIAKTQYSLSHDPSLKGRPEGFVVPIRDVRASVGAGYLYALAAEIMTIPGLPTHPGYLNIELDSDGEIEGMF